MKLREFLKAWMETQDRPRDFVVIKTVDGEIKADWFDIQPESRTIEGGGEIIFLYYNRKRVATVQVEDIIGVYCGYNDKKEDKVLTIEEFKELWNKSAQFDSQLKYMVEYTTIVDKCGTEIEAKDYAIEFTNEGDIVVNLYWGKKVIASVKLKNIVDVF